MLVIDDEKVLRENICYLLTRNKFDVFSADGGDSGFTLAKKIKPDVILCDILMPQNDGYWVLKQVKSNQNLLKVPFIFITAKAENDDIRKGMELGADAYLTKPFRIEELINVISLRLKNVKAYKTN